MLKEELNTVKRAHSECNKVVVQCENLKSQLKELEKSYDRMSNRFDTVSQEKKVLEIELERAKEEQKKKRALNVRIVDLE